MLASGSEGFPSDYVGGYLIFETVCSKNGMHLIYDEHLVFEVGYLISDKHIISDKPAIFISNQKY